VRRAGVRRSAVQLGERDMLLFDGHARPRKLSDAIPGTPGDIEMISAAGYRGMVRMGYVREPSAP